MARMKQAGVMRNALMRRMAPSEPEPENEPDNDLSDGNAGSDGKPTVEGAPESHAEGAEEANYKNPVMELGQLEECVERLPKEAQMEAQSHINSLKKIFKHAKVSSKDDEEEPGEDENSKGPETGISGLAAY